jgi:hypothetical protein
MPTMTHVALKSRVVIDEGAAMGVARQSGQAASVRVAPWFYE